MAVKSEPMSQFNPGRRRAIRGAVPIGALAAFGSWPPTLAQAGPTNRVSWISACARSAGGFALAMSSGEPERESTVHTDPLPVRGHAIAIDRNGQRAVAISRRPGRTAWVLDLRQKRSIASFSAPAKRHFQGHALFSADARLLFTTENAYEARRSVIGVWDTDNWQRVGEFPTHGIGAHSLQWMPDRKTLAVCNGGILTHPDFPRKKLNLDSMAPSLVYLDSTSGRLIDEYRPIHHQLSIRHLDVHHDGTVVIAMQRQQANGQPMALLARHRGEASLISARLNNTLSWHEFNAYIGDICLSADGQWAAFTSPRGGKLGFWHVAENRITQTDSMIDVCGIGYDRRNQVFLASAGTGDVRTYRLSDSTWQLDQTSRSPGIRWDNHLSLIS